ncbi:fibronectin-like isoform X2 [Branchiostoma floridae x Branchiostoma belcheri]
MRVEILGCNINSTLLWGLTLDDAGLSHLTVSWRVEGRLPISRYRLRYQPADGTGSYQDLSPAPGPDATSAAVLGLLAHTAYTLTLTSFDEDDQPNGGINGTCEQSVRVSLGWNLAPYLMTASLNLSLIVVHRDGPNVDG